MEGYDAKFDPPLDKRLECPICLLAQRDPMQTPCGHRFCSPCILRALRWATATLVSYSVNITLYLLVSLACSPWVCTCKFLVGSVPGGMGGKGCACFMNYWPRELKTDRRILKLCVEIALSLYLYNSRSGVISLRSWAYFWCLTSCGDVTFCGWHYFWISRQTTTIQLYSEAQCLLGLQTYH